MDVTVERKASRAYVVPSFGDHEEVVRYGVRLGAVVDVMGDWVAVCTHRACYRRLVARETSEKAKLALRHHWGARHGARVK